MPKASVRDKVAIENLKREKVEIKQFLRELPS